MGLFGAKVGEKRRGSDFNFARNVLQDGERVELDATNGVVRRLNN